MDGAALLLAHSPSNVSPPPAALSSRMPASGLRISRLLRRPALAAQNTACGQAGGHVSEHVGFTVIVGEWA